jgi:hypothetical protein
LHQMDLVDQLNHLVLADLVVPVDQQHM